MALKTFAGSRISWGVHPAWHYSCHQIHMTILSTSMSIGLRKGVMYYVCILVTGSCKLQIRTRNARNLEYLFSAQQQFRMILSCIVASNWTIDEIKQADTNIGYITQTASQWEHYAQARICGHMHGNATANHGEPHPIQQTKSYLKYPSFVWNNHTCYILEVL